MFLKVPDDIGKLVRPNLVLVMFGLKRVGRNLSLITPLATVMF